MPATLRAVPPAPPPDRDRLRAAIAAVAAAEEAIERASAARDRVHQAYLTALHPLDAARSALREAESQGQQRRLAHLLGGPTAGPTLDELRQAVTDSEAATRSIAADEKLLDDELARRQQLLASRVADRTEAVASLLAPAAADLIQRMHALRTEAKSIEAALRVVPGLPYGWDAQPQYREDHHLAEVWRDAIAALATDPGASIPPP
jgi:hypothetical protein